MGGGGVLVGCFLLWLFMVRVVGSGSWMCRRVVFVGGRGLGRGRWGVGGSVGSGACVVEWVVGKRVIVCVGSWQDCKMPGTRMLWRFS